MLPVHRLSSCKNRGSVFFTIFSLPANRGLTFLNVIYFVWHLNIFCDFVQGAPWRKHTS